MSKPQITITKLVRTWPQRKLVAFIVKADEREIGTIEKMPNYPWRARLIDCLDYIGTGYASKEDASLAIYRECRERERRLFGKISKEDSPPTFQVVASSK